MVAARGELGGVVGAPCRGNQLTPRRRATTRPRARRRRRRPRRGWDSTSCAACTSRVGRGDVAGKRFGHCEVRERRAAEPAVRVLEGTGRFAERRGRRARQSADEEGDPAAPDSRSPGGSRRPRSPRRRTPPRHVAPPRRHDRSAGQRACLREVEEQVDRRELADPLGRGRETFDRDAVGPVEVPDRRVLERGGQDGGRRRAREILGSDGARVAGGDEHRGAAALEDRPRVRIGDPFQPSRAAPARHRRTARAGGSTRRPHRRPRKLGGRQDREGPAPRASTSRASSVRFWSLSASPSTYAGFDLGSGVERRPRQPFRHRRFPELQRTARRSAELCGMRAIAGIDAPQRDAEQLGGGPVAGRFHRVGERELHLVGARRRHAVAEHFAEERVSPTRPADAPAVVT